MKFIIIFILVACHNHVFPQDSLLFYLSEAAKNNPSVLQKYHEYKASLQKVPQVGSLPDPELNMGVFLTPMELNGGDQVAEINLMQMFPWFGTLRAAKDEMSLMANAKYEIFRDAKLQVFYEVQSTWFNLIKVQQKIRISEKNIEYLKTIERLALVKFRYAPLGNSGTSSSGSSQTTNVASGVSTSSQGMGSMGSNTDNNVTPASGAMPQQNSMNSSGGGSSLADLYRIQIEAGDLENSIALLKNQENTLIAQFNSYLNRVPGSPVFLPDTLIADSLGMKLSLVSDSMLNNNPMLSMLQYEQQSLDARKKMVTKMGYPMIGLGLNYSVINKSDMSASPMNGKDMIMPMVTVTLPVYRKKYKAMQTEAEMLKTATLQNYDASVNSLNTEYYQAVQVYRDAQRRIELYDNQSLLAAKSLDIMLKSFTVSGSGLTDILRIQQQTLDYEYKHMEAIADFNTAIALLKRLMAFQHNN